MLKVLYVDGVGPFGGSSRSLFEVVKILSETSAAEPYFVAANGTALNFYGLVAKEIIATRGLSRFDNTRYSYYRGIRWCILLREIFHFPYMIFSLCKAKKQWKKVDVIHVNEVTEIIPALLAKWLFSAPLVVHVRSLQRVEGNSFRYRFINKILYKYADAIIAINENTRATLPENMNVDVIQNSFTALRSPNPDNAFLEKLKGLRPTSLKVGFVGNLHHSKGLFDLLDAAFIIAKTGRDVEFLIVGGVTIPEKSLKSWILEKADLAQDVEAKLIEQVNKYNLQQQFHLLGPTSDIQCVYEMLDVICFPSHYDAPGRPVFEAAFSAVPSIVSVNKPRPDTLIDGETGIAIPAHDPQKLAEAIIYFADNPHELERMGKNAKELAEASFSPVGNAKKLLAIYTRLVNSAKKI